MMHQHARCYLVARGVCITQGRLSAYVTRSFWRICQPARREAQPLKHGDKRVTLLKCAQKSTPTTTRDAEITLFGKMAACFTRIYHSIYIWVCDMQEWSVPIIIHNLSISNGFVYTRNRIKNYAACYHMYIYCAVFFHFHILWRVAIQLYKTREGYVCK